MQNELTVYEIGFHLNPSLPEAEVLGKVTDLKNQISERGGAFISESFPVSRPLAYTIVKRIGNENRRFNQSFFGWVKCELAGDAIVDLKKILENDTDVVRFLIIKTVREDTMISTKPEFKLSSEKSEDQDAGNQKVSPEKKEDLTPEEEAEIDKSIDELVSDEEEEDKEENKEEPK